MLDGLLLAFLIYVLTTLVPVLLPVLSAGFFVYAMRKKVKWYVSVTAVLLVLLTQLALLPFGDAVEEGVVAVYDSIIACIVIVFLWWLTTKEKVRVYQCIIAVAWVSYFYTIPAFTNVPEVRQAREEARTTQFEKRVEELESLGIQYYDNVNSVGRTDQGGYLSIEKDYVVVMGRYDDYGTKDTVFTHANRISGHEKCAPIDINGRVTDNKAPCLHLGEINGFDVWTENLEPSERSGYSLFKGNLLIFIDNEKLRSDDGATTYIEGLEPYSAKDFLNIH